MSNENPNQKAGSNYKSIQLTRAKWFIPMLTAGGCISLVLSFGIAYTEAISSLCMKVIEKARESQVDFLELNDCNVSVSADDFGDYHKRCFPMPTSRILCNNSSMIEQGLARFDEVADNLYETVNPYQNFVNILSITISVGCVLSIIFAAITAYKCSTTDTNPEVTTSVSNDPDTTEIDTAETPLLTFPLHKSA